MISFSFTGRCGYHELLSLELMKIPGCKGNWLWLEREIFEVSFETGIHGCIIKGNKKSGINTYEN